MTLRLTADFADVATLIDEKAVAARRKDSGFVVETDRGQRILGAAVLLSTGVMDRQPSVKLTTKSGRVWDDIRSPRANNESLLYCILCEGHLVRGTPVAVFGARTPPSLATTSSSPSVIGTSRFQFHTSRKTPPAKRTVRPACRTARPFSRSSAASRRATASDRVLCGY